MAKTKETIDLENRLVKFNKKQGIFGCLEVTIGWFGHERVDFITYDTNGIWKAYEIKVTKSDFYSKAHNSFIGQYNYYVMTRELYEQVKKDIPSYVGVYVEGEKWRELTSIKKALKQNLKVDEQILKNSLIRSLHREAYWNKKGIKLENDIGILEPYMRRWANFYKEVNKPTTKEYEAANRILKKLKGIE